MGVAAQHRGDALIAAHARRDLERARELEELSRIRAIANDCDTFVRETMEFLVQPTGMRALTVEGQKAKGGWKRRNDALVEAHNAWVHAPVDVVELALLSQRRARAAYALLRFALGSWCVPKSVCVPRCVLPHGRESE